MLENIPISENIIQPIIKSNICYVNNIEEFEKIGLEINQTFLAFDNFNQCFYIRSRDKYGEYSRTMIYFYKNFEQKVKSIEEEEFIKKCKEAKLDEVKSKIAYMFFKENKKPQEVWLWLLESTSP